MPNWNSSQLLGTRYFSSNPVSDAFLGSLRADLGAAAWGVISVCYFDKSGYQAVREPLTQLLRRSSRSKFLTMANCGMIEAVIDLARECARPAGQIRCLVPLGQRGVRGDPCHPDFQILHSKVAMLVMNGERDGTANVVLYVGSHNWTGPGLGAGQYKNIETSIRLEYRCDSALLEALNAEGNHQSHPIPDAYTQVMRTFVLASATDLAWYGAESEIREWAYRYCGGDQDEKPKTNEVVVAPAILSQDRHSRLPQRNNSPVPSDGDLIYVQYHRPPTRYAREAEGDGKSKPDFLKQAKSPWAIYLWPGPDSIGRVAPSIAICEVVSASEVPDSDQAQVFQWILCDPAQNVANASGEIRPTSAQVMMPAHGNDLSVYHWTLEAASPGDTSAILDLRKPDLHATLRVKWVIATSMAPGGEDSAPNAALAMCLASGKNRFALNTFPVSAEPGAATRRAGLMMQEQEDLFGIETGNGKLEPDPTAVPGTDVYDCEEDFNALLVGAQRFSLSNPPAGSAPMNLNDQRPRFPEFSGGQLGKDNGSRKQGSSGRTPVFRVVPLAGPSRTIPRWQLAYTLGHSDLVASLRLEGDDNRLRALFQAE